MKRYFTGTFFFFLSGFFIILAVAFGVIAFIGAQTAAPVDNTALPK